MSRRKKVPDQQVADLQFRADLRCCLCTYEGDLPPRAKSAQVHHIDGDPSNNAKENLVLLCLEHHEEVGRTSQSGRRIHAVAVARFRDDLERRVRHKCGRHAAPRTQGRQWFIAALDAAIVMDVARKTMDGSGEWEDVGAEVAAMAGYPEDMGLEARRAILLRLETLASQARHKMPAEVAAAINRATLNLLPLSFLQYEQRQKRSGAEVALLVLAARIGEALAYDGALKLGSLKICERGCEILWRVLSFAVIHKVSVLIDAVSEAFRTAIDGAARSGLSGASELVKLAQFHGEAGGTKPLDYPEWIETLL
jgi:hypothetical protein